MQNAPLRAFCNTFDLYKAIIGLENLFSVFFEWPFHTGFTYMVLIVSLSLIEASGAAVVQLMNHSLCKPGVEGSIPGLLQSVSKTWHSSQVEKSDKTLSEDNVQTTYTPSNHEETVANVHIEQKKTVRGVALTKHTNCHIDREAENSHHSLQVKINTKLEMRIMSKPHSHPHTIMKILQSVKKSS